jgi:hypothetical protein
MRGRFLLLSRSRDDSGCRRRGKLPSFLSNAIAPYTFLRELLLTITVSSSAWSSALADADLSGANSSPSGPLHTQRRAAGLPPSPAKGAASKDRLELAPTGGISSCRQATRIEQPGPIGFVISPFCFSGVPRNTFSCPRLQCLGPGRRVELCWEATRAPPQGPTPEWGGTMPPSAIRGLAPRR